MYIATSYVLLALGQLCWDLSLKLDKETGGTVENRICLISYS